MLWAAVFVQCFAVTSAKVSRWYRHTENKGTSMRLPDDEVPRWHQVKPPTLLAQSNESVSTAPTFEVEYRMEVTLGAMQQMHLLRSPSPIPQTLPADHRYTVDYTSVGLNKGETAVMLTYYSVRLTCEGEEEGYEVSLRHYSGRPSREQRQVGRDA